MFMFINHIHTLFVVWMSFEIEFSGFASIWLIFIPTVRIGGRQSLNVYACECRQQELQK
jgi:hypothetical protein